MPRSIRHPLAAPALALLLAAAGGAPPAQATVVAQVYTPYNFYGISGNDGAVSSTLDCSAGVCTVYNELQFSGGDAAVRLVWRDVDGYTLLSGQVPWDVSFGDPNRSIGRTTSVDYVGFFFGQPSYVQYTGEADFRGSIGVNPPCFSFVCEQDYLELDWRIPNPFPNGRQGGATPAALDAPLSIRWAMSELGLPLGAPPNTAPTRQEAYAFSSRVESVGDEFLYTYELVNHTLDDFDFTLDALGWAGTVEAEGSVQWVVASALAPRGVRQDLVASAEQTELFAAGIDVLQPVPEPSTWALWGLGLAGLVWSAPRLRRARP